MSLSPQLHSITDDTHKFKTILTERHVSEQLTLHAGGTARIDLTTSLELDRRLTLLRQGDLRTKLFSH